MAASVNDLLVDEAIRHQIAVVQYSNDAVRRIVGMLNSVDADLASKIYELASRLPPDSFTMQRLESLLGSVRALNANAFGMLRNELTTELRDFVNYENAYQFNMLDTMTPPSVHVASVNAEQVFSAAMSHPFQGVLLSGALADVGAARMRAIERTIAQGYVENQGIDQIVRSLIGTRSQGYADGILNRPRYEVAAIVRTSVSHMQAYVRDKQMSANADIVKALQWVSTIDLRTTPFCQARDGHLYRNSDQHEPIDSNLPWGGGPGAAHWNCRSVGVAVFRSLPGVGEFWAGGTRATMDGQAPRSVTYVDWLKRQTAARQDAVLGPTRGKLLRQGGLRLEDMYTRDGQYMTLDQLREHDAAAFRRAGL